MTPRIRLLIVLFTVPVLAFVVVGHFLGNASAQNPTYRHLRVFEDVVSLISTNYVEQADMDRVMGGAMRGLAEGLDGDSAYLPPDEVRYVESPGVGTEADVGISLTRQYYLRIVAVRDQSPAARAGLLTGDYVRAIDGKPTRETSAIEGAHLLRGKAGTPLSLVVIRGNTADPHKVDLVREAPSWPEVSARTIRPGTAVIRVAAFGPDMVARLRTELKDLAAGGARRFVIDLRNSAEGPIERGIEAARLFIASGTLTIRDSRDGGRQTIAAAPGDGGVTAPMVVLVDIGTSGPAEVFAAAMQGNRRAELVGERTQGRTALQELAKLPDGSGLWLSHAAYLTPGGSPINEHGLVPDLAVEIPDVEFGAVPPAEDLLVVKAVERLAARGRGSAPQGR